MRSTGSLLAAVRLPPLFLFLLLAALLGALAGCSRRNPAGEGEPAMAPAGSLPEEIRQAPQTVRQAYQFAAANPQVLQQLPCYCGCGAVGHASNYDCYLSGEAEYDPHALACSICVDITQDAMRLLEQGKSLQEIRSYVDETYARFGPSNMP